jgi:hypothetical protein
MNNPSSLLRAAMLGAFAALFAIGLGLLHPPSTNAAFTDTDGDGAIDLTEEILGSDPADAQSTPEDTSFPFLARNYTACFDTVDNDHDGLVDSGDSGCTNSDGDSISDAAELLLGSNPDSDKSFPEDARLDNVLVAVGYPFLTCADGGDDDGDGLMDSADPGCARVDSDGDGFGDAIEKGLGADWEDANSRPEHDGISPISCVDGIDNDHDGLVDAADPGCVVAPNDDFADAIVVDTLPFTHTAKVVAASSEPGEQESSCFFAEEPRQTVWYRFTAPHDTRVVVDTTGSDSLGAVTVWRQGAFALEEVECGTPFFSFGSSSANRFAFAASAGEAYFIQIERYGQELGASQLDLERLSFRMEAVTPPANDDYPANSVWYRYTGASDSYVLASSAEGTDFGATIGVFEGASLASLVQVACGEGNDLAFHALAGHSYYFQAAGYQCQRPGGGGLASFCLDSRSGHLELRVEAFTMPTCPPTTFTMADPRGDADDDYFPLDVASLSVALGGELVCITATMEPPVAPPDIGAWLELDADLQGTNAGGSHIVNACDYPTGIEYDHRIFVDRGDEGLLTYVSDFDAPGGRTAHPAYFTYDGSTATIILPLSSIGGDTEFRFALEMSHWDTYDCAPNGGNITCQNGACAFVPFRNGDVNCNLRTDSVDAVITLQYSAGLFHDLACPNAADINGDGRIDSLDASLILQFEAGLIDQLPPPVCRFPHEFC